PGRGDAAGHGDVPPEQRRADRALFVLRDADAADRTARAHDPDSHLEGGLRADAFEDGVRALAAGQFADLRDALLAAFGDDVGRAELAAEVRPCLVASHEDDPLGAEALRGEDGGEADRAVADHGDVLALSYARLRRGVVAGREDVR